MRFFLVDRVLHLAPEHAIEVVKNVSATEDVFDDHFPGYPIFPGALIVEVFDQATQLLIGVTHGWEMVGRLERLSRASFRRFVHPGDQLRVRCERRRAGAGRWGVVATATVDGVTVATATLDVALEPAAGSSAAKERAGRLASWHRVLQQAPPDASPFADPS
jgi:3-hydroxyacyl-[acyl-carrier-protein] dehydratase